MIPYKSLGNEKNESELNKDSFDGFRAVIPISLDQVCARRFQVHITKSSTCVFMNTKFLS